MAAQKPLENFAELKAALAKHWEEGKQIISHFNRLEREYSDWEDRLVALENAVSDKESVLLKKPEKAKNEKVELDIEDIFE